jgi:putative exporter of polyketide antibiotics
MGGGDVPYSHIALAPAQVLGWVPLLTLCGVAVGLITLGITKLVKRDIA